MFSDSTYDPAVNTVRKSFSKPNYVNMRCFRRNLPNVKANHPNCKPIDRYCKACGRKGHFASVCFRSGAPKAQESQNGGVSSNSNVSHSLLKFVSIKCHTAEQTNSSTITVSNLRFGIDTGSSLTCIPFRLNTTMVPDLPLRQSNETFRDFSGNLLPIHVYMTVQFSWEGHSSIGKLFVVI